MDKFNLQTLRDLIHVTPKVKRYVIIMSIGVIINEVLAFAIAPLNLPLWLDMAGTALTAILLEPAAGIIVAFINNFILSVFQYDASSIIYLSLGASVAIICGTRLKEKKDFTLKNMINTWILVIIVTSILTAIMTMWRKNGVSDLLWEQYFYNLALNQGLPKIFACFFGAFIVKIPDMTVSALCVFVMYRIIPTKWKEKKSKIEQKTRE